MTADIQANLARTSDKDRAPAGAARRPACASSAGPPRSSRRPTRRFITGHTLVVDGANWQRRSLTNPPVVTVRDQMGKDPFTL